MSRFLSSDCAAGISDEHEISDSDSLPSLGEILARPRQVIDLTLDDNGGNGDDDDPSPHNGAHRSAALVDGLSVE
jgi:hypothetical protein